MLWCLLGADTAAIAVIVSLEFTQDFWDQVIILLPKSFQVIQVTKSASVLDKI